MPRSADGGGCEVCSIQPTVGLSVWCSGRAGEQLFQARR